MSKGKKAKRSETRRTLEKKKAPAPAPAVAEAKITYETPRMLLLAPYAIIPASLLVILVDQLFLGRWIQSHFPTLPEDLLFFVIFFNLPHIAASTVTLLDGDYLKHYGMRLLLPALVLAGVLIGFPNLIYNDGFTAVLYLWTVIHVVGQQFGLTRLLGAGFGRLYFWWKWSALLTGILIYFGIYAGEQIAPGVFKMILSSFGIPDGFDVQHVIRVTGWLMLLPFLAISWLIYRAATTRLGRIYVFGNTATMICVVGLYTLHYPFFVILIPRVLHDFSAFIFYISHDLNRNRHGAKNTVYRFLKFSRIPVYILCPAIAIAFAFPISYYSYLQSQDYVAQGWAYRLLVLITLLHYYTDGFVWKNGAMHREYIKLR